MEMAKRAERDGEVGGSSVMVMMVVFGLGLGLEGVLFVGDGGAS